MGLWPNLLRKTAITTTFYFPAEDDSVCTRKKSVSVNSIGSDFSMEKTGLHRLTAAERVRKSNSL